MARVTNNSYPVTISVGILTLPEYTKPLPSAQKDTISLSQPSHTDLVIILLVFSRHGLALEIKYLTLSDSH